MTVITRAEVISLCLERTYNGCAHTRITAQLRVGEAIFPVTLNVHHTERLAELRGGWGKLGGHVELIDAGDGPGIFRLWYLEKEDTTDGTD